MDDYQELREETNSDLNDSAAAEYHGPWTCITRCRLDIPENHSFVFCLQDFLPLKAKDLSSAIMMLLSPCGTPIFTKFAGIVPSLLLA